MLLLTSKGVLTPTEENNAENGIDSLLFCLQTKYLPSKSTVLPTLVRPNPT